ncbi:MAG: phenylalanine--tRNA ligase subunit beta, partial [Aureibaculum sp.]
HKFENGFDEQKHFSLLLTGNRNSDSWINTNRRTDFFYLKGIINSILERIGINSTGSKPSKNDIFSEGITLQLGKKTIVEFGVVKPRIAKEFGIKQEVLYADFNWDNILSTLSRKDIKISELPKFPAVKRDLALLLDKDVNFDKLYELAFQVEKDLLKSVDLFDVYEGDKLSENKKSYALSFLIQDETKTLNDKQIDNVMQKLLKAFEVKLNAELRA